MSKSNHSVSPQTTSRHCYNGSHQLPKISSRKEHLRSKAVVSSKAEGQWFSHVPVLVASVPMNSQN
jgi:hypothetical protein